jgi:hypothetical protein
MTKLFASLFVLAIVAASLPAKACPFNDEKTAQTTPVVTSDATDTAPMTPVPPPESTTTTTPATTKTAPKTGG